MDLISEKLHHISQQLVINERFAANLLGITVMLTALSFAWMVLGRLSAGVISVVGRILGGPRTEGFFHQLTRHVHALLAWTATLGMVAIVAGGLSYHFSGRNIQIDAEKWYDQLTVEHLTLAGMYVIGGMTSLVVLWFVTRLVSLFRYILERNLRRSLGSEFNSELWHSWLGLLERYLEAVLFLGAILLGSDFLMTHDLMSVPVYKYIHHPAWYVFLLFTVVSGARLMVMAFHGLARPVAEFLDRNLAGSILSLYWERLTNLVPLAERCFEAATYVCAATIMIHNVERFSGNTVIGERILLCIGIFFGARVVIELIHVGLNQAFGLYKDSEATQVSRTLVPLLQSVGQYLIYFGALVMMFEVWTLDTKALLGVAGIFGLAAGLGAQNLLSDVISGLVILFENQYLVGDHVEIGNAKGIVEAVTIRHTQIRTPDGKLHMIPNGQVKDVVNSSKGYVNIVVDLKVPAGSNLEAVMHAMAEAGQQLRQQRRDVLGETQIQGLVDLTLSEMTVRAVTRVRPGSQFALQNEYRKLLRDLLERSPAEGLKLKAA
ncbi:MAG: mechanosensitive ion channel [Planctomycetales bacterium]